MEGIITVIVIVGVAILLFLGFLFAIKSWLFGRFIVKEFKKCNVVVDGKKGTGKDLLFQYVVHKRNAHYYANISYGDEKYTHLDPKDCSIAPNTYKQFINGEVKKITDRFYEGEDFYFSDGGTFFPNYVDNILNMAYPYLPVTYALSRHISNANIHVNIQNLGRLWKKLREQADFFVHCCGVVNLGLWLGIKCYTYDTESSALARFRPVHRRLWNKYDRAEKDIYEAEKGDIRSGWVIIPKRWIKYDTRAFEKVIYGDTPRRNRADEEKKKKELAAKGEQQAKGDQ